MKKLLFLLAMCAAQGAWGTETRVISNLPLNFFQAHGDAIRADAPFTSIAQSDTGEVWLAGNNSLWKWHPELGSLKKLEINSEGQSKVLAYGRDAAIYSTKSKVYLVYDNPPAVKQIYSGQVGAVAISPRSDILVAGQPSFLINFDLKTKRQIPIDLSSCKELREFDGENLICRNKYSVKFYNIHQVKSGLKVIESKIPIKEATSIPGGFLTASDKSVWVTNLKGDLLKTIIPSQDRKIAAAYFNSAHHIYLFGDRLLEINDAKTGQKVITTIEGPNAKTVGELSFHDGRVGILLDGFPHLFQLDKNWK